MVVFVFIKSVGEYLPTPRPRTLVGSAIVVPVLSRLPKRKAPSPLPEDQHLSQTVFKFEKSLDQVSQNSITPEPKMPSEKPLDNSIETHDLELVSSTENQETEKVEPEKSSEFKKVDILELQTNTQVENPHNEILCKDNNVHESGDNNFGEVITTNSFDKLNGEQIPVINSTTPVKESNDSDLRRRSCKIISTIPKCDHFEGIRLGSDDYEISNQYSNYSINKSQEENIDLTKKFEREESDGKPEENLKTWKSLDQEKQVCKRAKIFRSQSELSNFEINTPERHGRHLTSHAEDFMCALNTNLSTNIPDLSATSSRSDKTGAEKFSTGQKEKSEFQFTDSNVDCQRISVELKDSTKKVEVSRNSGACRCFTNTIFVIETLIKI